MRVLPSPQAISRMEETLTWTACLKPIDDKIVWMRAHGERNEKLTRIGGQLPLMTAFLTACPFAPRCSHATDRCLRENPSLVPVEAGEILY